MLRGFCTAPPGLVSLDTAIAVLRSRVTVSTIASRRPLSCCLSVRFSVLPTCSVTTSAFDGASTLICCCSESGTFLLTTNFSAISDDGSNDVPVPSLTSVVSRLSGILAILPLVYVDSRSAAIRRAAPNPMSPHAAIRSATARFKPCLLVLVATTPLMLEPVIWPRARGTSRARTLSTLTVSG